MSYFNLNTSFDKFVKDILLSTKENSELSQKKQNVETKIKSHIQDKDVKITEIFTSGSYATKTAIQPVGVKKSYDIDFGIVLDDNRKVYTPKSLKCLVYNALNGLPTVKGFTKEVTWKEPCITAQYATGDSVDVAVYIRKDDVLYLLRGKEHDDIWLEPADPKGLLYWFKSQHQDKLHRRQLRRIIRLLKYWAYNKFNEKGHQKPPSICLLVDAVKKYRYYEDDIDALYNIVKNINRDTCKLPVCPKSEILHKMTTKQKEDFAKKLLSFTKLLKEIQSSEDIDNVGSKLQTIFGSKFPIGQIKSKYDRHKNEGISPSSTSA